VGGGGGLGLSMLISNDLLSFLIIEMIIEHSCHFVISHMDAI
jgi:hypothetical protein